MKLKRACGLVGSLAFGAFNLLLILCLMQFSGSFSAATDVETLKQRNITHILTLDICPLPVHITELPFLKTKYIQGIDCHKFYKLKRFYWYFVFLLVSDTPQDELLCHFEDCFSFIEDALSNNQVVLVHWYECLHLVLFCYLPIYFYPNDKHFFLCYFQLLWC